MKATPKRGDLVFFKYGCMCGEDTGTVLAEETNDWGTHYWVRLSDFSVTTFSDYIGEVEGEVCQDYAGEEFFSAHESTLYTPTNGSPIGAYLVAS